MSGVEVYELGVARSRGRGSLEVPVLGITGSILAAEPTTLGRAVPSGGSARLSPFGRLPFRDGISTAVGISMRTRRPFNTTPRTRLALRAATTVMACRASTEAPSGLAFGGQGVELACRRATLIGRKGSSFVGAYTVTLL